MARRFFSSMTFPFDLPTFVIAAAVMFGSYVVFGITAFGAALFTVPTLSFFFPLDFVLPMCALIDATAALSLGLRISRDAAWPELRWMIPLSLAGAIAGVTQRIAIKTLHQHLSNDAQVVARFNRECATVVQLKHPNTIRMEDFGQTEDGTLYIAMEFVAGRPLSEVIEKEGPLSPERVTKIMRQVCGVLDEAHQQGVIHRDLKPENIVLTNRAGETDFVKVLDFGIAARTEGTDTQKEQKLTQQGMVLGTPPYMSPEQFTGKALDARSDIYSLAVMAYEMLTRKLPFEADTPWQWATQHMTAQPIAFEVSAPATNIPPAMKAAILKGLSKNRDEREPTARDFFAEFSEGARMTVVSSPNHAATGTPKPCFSRSRTSSGSRPRIASRITSFPRSRPTLNRSGRRNAYSTSLWSSSGTRASSPTFRFSHA